MTALRHALPAVAGALLVGCGGTLFAPDALVKDAGAQAYLDRISQECGKLTVGGHWISKLVDDANSVPQGGYFLDVTSKLYFGRITPEQYATQLNAFFPMGNNTAGIDCVVSKLPATRP